MKFLESELPMPLDEEFAFRYYTLAEREALEGILVEYEELAQAVKKSKEKDAKRGDNKWGNAYGKVQDCGVETFDAEKTVVVGLLLDVRKMRGLTNAILRTDCVA